MHFRRSILALCLSAASLTPALVGAQQTRPAISVPVTPQAAPAAGAGAGAGTAASAPVAASADPNTPAVSSDSYVIGPGDVLQLVVWREPNLSNSGVPVRPDGRISLALLGDIPASGKTPMALGREIADRLKQFITDPLVTVTMVAVTPKEIFLIGEVNHTGPVILAPGMNLLQAIAVSGGLSPFAKQKKLYILRKSPKGDQKIPFDYKKALNSGNMQGITLQPGDTIVVP